MSNAREYTLKLITYAGYHNDGASWARLYSESRISRKSADIAWYKGVELRRNGARCGCSDCQKTVVV